MTTEIQKHEKTHYVGSLGRYLTDSELQLTESEKQFVAAKRSPKLYEVLESEVGSKKVAAYLQKLLATAKAINSTNAAEISPDLKSVFVTASLRMLSESEFRWLTVAELQIAAERGMQGCYGNFLSLSVANLRNWVRSLRSDCVRSQAIAKHQALTAPEPEPEPDSVKLKRALARLSHVIVEVVQRSDALSDPQCWHLLKQEIDRIKDARLVHDLLKEHDLFLPDYEEQKRLYWQTSESEIAFGWGTLQSEQESADGLAADLIRAWRIGITKRRLLADFALFVVRTPDFYTKLKTLYDSL